jgi:phosphoglycolate phosphatase
MSELRLIVFDCDGTLVDSGHIIVSIMTSVWKAEGLTPPEADLMRRQIGLSLMQAIANLYPEGDADIHARLTEGYKQESCRLQSSNVHEEPLYEGCADVLMTLAAQDGYILGVATGKGRRGLDHTLKHHGIADHFSILKTADDGPGKPHPQILQDAIQEIGVTPWQTAVIGDTIFDIGMAVRAGAHAIGVSWGYHSPEELKRAGARAVARHYHEIPALLADIWKEG